MMKGPVWRKAKNPSKKLWGAKGAPAVEEKPELPSFTELKRKIKEPKK